MPDQGQAVLIGGCALDVQATPDAGSELQPGGSVPGTVTFTSGGVARNIAECLARILQMDLQQGAQPLLISAVGDDGAAQQLVQHCESVGIDVSGVTRHPGCRTACISITYGKGVAAADNCHQELSAVAAMQRMLFSADLGGDVAASVADVTLLERQLTPAALQAHRSAVQTASLVLLDANLSTETLQAAAQMASAASIPVWFEPVSAPKAVRCCSCLQHLTYLSPNAAELLAIASRLQPVSMPAVPAAAAAHRTLPEAHQQLWRLAPAVLCVLKAGAQCIVLTLGAWGAALCRLGSDRETLEMQHMPAVPACVVSTGGAGDSLVAGAISQLLRGHNPQVALAFGMAVASQALSVSTNVPTSLDARQLQTLARETMARHTPLKLPCKLLLPVSRL